MIKCKNTQASRERREFFFEWTFSHLQKWAFLQLNLNHARTGRLQVIWKQNKQQGKTPWAPKNSFNNGLPRLIKPDWLSGITCFLGPEGFWVSDGCILPVNYLLLPPPTTKGTGSKQLVSAPWGHWFNPYVAWYFPQSDLWANFIGTVVLLADVMFARLASRSEHSDFA